MTQTTGAIAFSAATVEIGTDATCDIDVSNVGAGVAVSGGSRAVGEAHTFDGDEPIIGPGKRSPVDVAVRFLYSETTTEAFTKALAIYRTTGAACFIQWVPSGQTGTVYEFQSAKAGVQAAGIMTEFLYPGGEAQGGALIPGGFTVHCQEILQTTESA